MTWLAERQAVTAANIANTDTPGYRAAEVMPFNAVVESARAELAMTSPMHQQSLSDSVAGIGLQTGASWGSAHSGNNISIEQELMTAGSTSRMMNFDASIVRSFHRMLLTSLKV